MAEGIEPKPIIMGDIISTTFDNLINYGTGIYILQTTSADPNRPSSYQYWEVIQITLVVNGADYCTQIAMDTSGTKTLYMRKHYANGPMVWTPWSTITFS